MKTTIFGPLSFFCFLLICLGGVCQTVTLPQAKTTQPTIPAGTTLCTVPKNGGPCKTATAIPLPSLAVTFALQTVPVTLSGFTGTFTCSISGDGGFAKNPDGSITITGLACTVGKP